MDYSLLVGVHRMVEGEQVLSREATVDTQKDRGRLSMFHQDEGGLLTPVTDGAPVRELYYIGIIDMLQTYNAEKQVAHFFKSMKYNHVSGADPGWISLYYLVLAEILTIIINAEKNIDCRA